MNGEMSFQSWVTGTMIYEYLLTKRGALVWGKDEDDECDF